MAVSNYGSNEELDSKLAPGQSGYDIVVPSASYYERQIKSGYYQRIDKAQVPNLGNLDPEILERIAVHDPGNEYAVIHMWGTTGIGYNVAEIKKRMPARRCRVLLRTAGGWCSTQASLSISISAASRCSTRRPKCSAWCSPTAGKLRTASVLRS